jgi:hypothetical protein
VDEQKRVPGGDSRRRSDEPGAASAIYGLVVCSSPLAASVSGRLSLVAVSVLVTVTVAVHWVAESYAHALAHHAVKRLPLGWPDISAILSQGWPMVSASCALLGTLVLSARDKFLRRRVLRFRDRVGDLGDPCWPSSNPLLSQAACSPRFARAGQWPISSGPYVDESHKSTSLGAGGIQLLCRAGKPAELARPHYLWLLLGRRLPQNEIEPASYSIGGANVG